MSNTAANDNLTPRVRELKKVFLNTLSSTTVDYPYWFTRKWNELEGEVTVVRRAAAFKHAMSHLTPVIYPGETLVMARERYLRGSFPMPWLSEGYFLAHSSELYQAALKSGSASADEVSQFGTGGGNVTRSAGNVISVAGKFGLRKEEVPALSRIAEAWVDRSVQDVSLRYEQKLPEYELKQNIMRSVVCMFDGGYTLPQGREVANYYYPLQYGFGGLIELCRQRRDEVAGECGGDGIIGMDRLYFYEAAILVLEGVQNWINNYAREARRLEAMETDETQKKEYGEIAERLEWIAVKPARNFRDALQVTYTTHLAILNEDCCSGYSLGRLGQVLYPYFEQDIEAGRITEEDVVELMMCHRFKISNIDSFASSGVVGGVLSGNTFNNLSIGGLTSDGFSAENRLEELIIEAGLRNRTTQPTLSVLYNERLSEKYLLKVVECIKSGVGYPAFMNLEVGQIYMLNQFKKEGMTIEEARASAIGGCLEISPCCWLPLTLNGKTYELPGGCGNSAGNGVHFLSHPKILELVIFNGYDHRTGLQVFPAHNKPLDTYEQVVEVFKSYLEMAADVVNKSQNIEHDIWRKNTPAVFSALTKPDCLTKGHHIGNLGLRYNATFIMENCGVINFINSLAALKKLVYVDRKYTIEQMRDAIENNFGFEPAEKTRNYSLATQVKADGGEKYDEIHNACMQAPKYGNADAFVDSILKGYEDYYCSMSRGFESLWGHKLSASQMSATTHAPLGAVTMATPDGRLSGTTFADGSMSAYTGTDVNGPFALFQSATVWNQSGSQNSQMNVKVHPSALKGVEGARKLLELTRAYMRRGGFHVQYNVVDSNVLKAAQKSPDEFRELLVRVAGFTAYWVELGKPIQDEVVARTEYDTAG